MSSQTIQSSQKFIARNRAPRVQIEYDVELYGAQRKVEIPFVMGVLADLSGSGEAAATALPERSFLEISIDNFDDRLKALQPRARLRVPDALQGAGELAVDIRFERLADFSPEAVARQVPPLARLLEARTQLKDLLTYMDGKAAAETLLARLLADPPLLLALAGAPVPSPATA